MVSVLAVFGATLTGCPGMDGTVPDGQTGSQGLTLTWRADPSIPTTQNPSVTEATLKVRSVRVIGDAGDSATTKERFELKWSNNTSPQPILFDQAPAGKYAKIDVIIRGFGSDDDSLEIAGTVRIAGTDYRYQIEDKAQISASITLPSSAILSPGGALSVGVKVNLQDVVRDIDFASIEPDGNEIKIDEDSPAVLAAVRAALEASLSLDP